MTTILGHVHEVLAAAGQDTDDDLDLDPALGASVQHSLRSPHFATGIDTSGEALSTLEFFRGELP